MNEWITFPDSTLNVGGLYRLKTCNPQFVKNVYAAEPVTKFILMSFFFILLIIAKSLVA